MRRIPRTLACAFLLLAGLTAWRGVAGNGFLYDDDTFIVQNPGIRSLRPSAKFLSSAVTSDNPQMNGDVWRPLTTYSYALTYWLSGLDARRFHRINLFLHLVNALLVFWLALRLAGGSRVRDGPAAGDAGFFTAFAAALVFLLHPVQAETVAWVSQRSNELFLLFYLASFLFFIEASHRPGSAYWLSASLACFGLSLLSKEMAVSLPLALWGWSWLLRRRGPGRAALDALPHALLAAAFVLARAWALGHTAQTGYWAGGFVPQMLTMLKGFFLYARLALVPYPLSVEYLFPSKTGFDLELAGCATALAAIAWCAWRLRAKRPVAAFGLFLFFAALAPVSNVVPIRAIINERFLYLSVAGFGLALGNLLEGSRRLRWAALTALACAYAGVDQARIPDWKDHESFVTANLRTCPQSATLRFGMGRAFAAKGLYAEAEREYKTALAIDPDYSEALNDLGLISAKEGRAQEAIALYRRSIQKRVDFAEALANLGAAALGQGMELARSGKGEEELRQAARALERAAALKPGDLRSRSNLAAAYAGLGRLEEAVALSREVLRADPGLERTRANLRLFSRALRERDDTTARWDLGRRYADGYRLASSGAAVEVRPLDPGKDPPLTQEAFGAAYREAAPGLDVLIVPRGPAFETFYLLKTPAALRGVAYAIEPSGRAAAAAVNAAGELELRTAEGAPLLALTRPLAIDARGRKAPGDFILEDGVFRIALPEDLDYPVLVDPAWRTLTDALATNRVFETATLLPDGRVLIAGGQSANATFQSTADLYDPNTGVINPTGTMSSRRFNHVAVLLPTGKVLVAGGQSAAATYLSTAQLYDPKTGAFAATGSMSAARSNSVAVLLSNGKVLLAGGQNAAGTFLSTTELYDPAAGTFAATGSMGAARASHTATRLASGKVLMAGGLGATGVYLSTAELYDPAAGTFAATGSMASTRASHMTTLLPTGKALVAGGLNGAYLSTAELYDPAAGTFSATGSMATARANQSHAALPDGKVLVAGGNAAAATYLSTAELYDPAAGTFSTTGSMASARANPTAVLLPSGAVLIAGGQRTNTARLASVELYNPSAGTFAATGSLATPRAAQSSTLLPSGKVLVAGGIDGSVNLSTAELYDPAAGTFAATGSMATSHRDFMATLLPTGKVLVAGGYSGAAPACASSAELYDPSAGTFSTTGSMSTPRRQSTATLMLNGQVLVAGGFNGNGSGTAFASAEIYNIAGGTFSATGSLNTARAYHTATYLKSGKVLVAGGETNGSTFLSTAELYDPSARTFTATGSMTTRRQYHTATLLASGKVLLSGGDAGGTPFSTAELYDPAAGTFAATGSMTTGRHFHTATMLPSGKVLVTGGDNGTTALASAEVYDPALGIFAVSSGAMTTAREYHTANMLTNGKVLLIGGSSASILSSAELVRYTEYDYSAYASVKQPVISNVVAVSTSAFRITGANFTGYGGGSQGGTQSSPTDQPRAYLQFMDSGNYGNMPGNSDLVDVSSTAYPMTAAQWGAVSGSFDITIPDSLRNGDYMLYVMASAVPSEAWVMSFGGAVVPPSYTTMVGTASGWRWAVPTTTDTVRSGSPDDWSWRLWTPGSGRQVPQGDASDWAWAGE